MRFALITMLTLLSGCVDPSQYPIGQAPIVQTSPNDISKFHRMDGKIMTIAVYQFKDMTGQRKPSGSASLSSAVTQGAEVWVIKALQDVGHGTWFEVVERVGLDNLVKERQLVRNTREVYEKNLANGPTPLKPMVFAGLILEGGIVGYDSSVATGGSGAKYLGIGIQQQYRVDTVTVVMRLVSVNTGKVLLSVATEQVQICLSSLIWELS